jgi:4-amino-4-deoxy-L-arabinose transferase-like glycosyltransferase
LEKVLADFGGEFNGDECAENFHSAIVQSNGECVKSGKDFGDLPFIFHLLFGYTQPMENFFRRFAKSGNWIIIFVALSLAVVNSIQNPPFEPPDEILHYQFVEYLIENRSLPIQPRTTVELSQFHQPPLYYLVGALLTSQIQDDHTVPSVNPHWTSYKAYDFHHDNKTQYLPSAEFSFPYSGTALVVHVLRFWSIILLFGTLLISKKLGKVIWPGDNAKQLLLLAIVAFNPMFLYISSAINNDNLVVLLGSILLYLTLIALKNGFSWRTTIFLGLVCGLAILSKISGLLLGFPLLVGLGWVGWQARSWRLFISRAAVIGILVLLISGWWFGRNMRFTRSLRGWSGCWISGESDNHRPLAGRR